MKENILFGQPFDVEKYSAVIYACALVEVRNFLSYSTKTPFDPLKSRGHNIQDRITLIALCWHFFPACNFTFTADLEYKHLMQESSLYSVAFCVILLPFPEIQNQGVGTGGVQLMRSISPWKC